MLFQTKVLTDDAILCYDRLLWDIKQNKNQQQQQQQNLLNLILTIFEHINMPLLMYLVVPICIYNIQLLKFRKLTEWLQECLHIV